jgi:magnesium-transporting ATPase (P-type)
MQILTKSEGELGEGFCSRSFSALFLFCLFYLFFSLTCFFFPFPLLSHHESHLTTNFQLTFHFPIRRQNHSIIIRCLSNNQNTFVSFLPHYSFKRYQKHISSTFNKMTRKKVIGIIVLASLLASGIVMNFLACTIRTFATTWWPIFSGLLSSLMDLLPLLLLLFPPSPFPLIIHQLSFSPLILVPLVLLFFSPDCSS